MKKLLYLFTLTGFLFLTSCDEKTLVENLDANVEAAKAYVLGETAFFDVFKVVDKAVRDTVLWSTGAVNVDGAQVSLLPGDSGVLVDYGATNVVCPDGKQRRGAIRILMDGDYLDHGAELSVGLEGYHYEDNAIEGTQTLNNNFTATVYEIQMEVLNGKVTETNGNVLNWNTTRILRWLEGTETPYDITDDKVAIMAGSTVNGNVVGGNSYNVSVLNNLEYGRDCQWITKGVIEITIPGLPVETGTVDFGNGECDAKVTFLFGGSSIPYMMK